MTVVHPPKATTPFLPVSSVAGLEELRALVNSAIDVLRDVAERRTGPVPPGGPEAVRAAAAATLPATLLPTDDDGRRSFTDMVRAYAEWSVDLAHPATVARMQCPPTPVAAAAELVTATLNQTLHAWEGGPFGLELDRWVVDEFASIVGFPAGAGGTVTAGGSVSNLMALMVARDNIARRHLGTTAFHDGIAKLGKRPIVLCSSAVHFSITRGVGITGIGEQGILAAPSDTIGRIIPDELDALLATLPDADRLPVMVIACAGATELGWVDDLPALAEVARKHGVWLHADAAYGGGALFSDSLRGLLDGIAEADSVTLDLHKFGWTPAASSVFLVRDAETLNSMDPATTLNAADDKLAGYFGRYTTSVQSTRRVNAFKIATTMQVLGRDGMAARVEACHNLARHAASRLAAANGVQLAWEPPLSMVVFRFLPAEGIDADRFNAELRRDLMADGAAMLARTTVPQEDGTSPVFLKLMLLNPDTTTEELDGVIDLILEFAVAREGFRR